MSFNHQKRSLFHVAPPSSSTHRCHMKLSPSIDARESKQDPQRIPAIIPFTSGKVETHDVRR